MCWATFSIETLPCVVQSNVDWTYFILGCVCAPLYIWQQHEILLMFQNRCHPWAPLGSAQQSLPFCALGTFFFLTGKRKKDGGRKSIFRARELSELTSENSCHSPAQNSTCDWGLGTFVGQASVLWKLLIPDPYLTYFLFFFKKIFFKKYLFMCMYMWVYMLTQARRRHQIPLDLKLQVAGTCPMWMVGSKLGSTRRAVSPFNC